MQTRSDWVLILGGAVSHDEEIARLVGEGARLCCADAGLDTIRRLGLRPPDLAVGDFDSASPDALAWAAAAGVEIVRHPVAKNASDGELALDEAVARGARTVALFGATGSRLDQTIATALLLARFEAREVAVIGHAPGWCYRVLAAGKATSSAETAPIAWTIPCSTDAMLSLVPLDRHVAGVTLTGVTFPLENATLERASTFATSNRAVADRPNVSLRSGQLLVLFSRE